MILLNGPPASGKSTLAARFVDSHPLTLNLDIDVVRHLLGGWADQPAAAGMLARQLAMGMARSTLEAGHDVIVPQVVAREELLGDLEQLARDTGAQYVEVTLTASRQEMRDWFAARATTSDAATHRDAQLLIDRLGGAAALDELYDDLVELMASRPHARPVPARRGDVAGTLRDLERALADDRRG